MGRTYEWRGEAEVVVPFTLDGPRVCEAGDRIRVAEDDDSFVDHPLWAQVESDTPDPTPTPVPEPAPEPVEVPEISTPDEPVVQEPTA